MTGHGNEEKKLDLTIIVDGMPQKKEFVRVMRVEEVIKSLLPAGEKQNWDKYQLFNRAAALDPYKSLDENGVTEGATLSLTKKDGGGGF